MAMRRRWRLVAFIIFSAVIVFGLALYFYHAENEEVKEQRPAPTNERAVILRDVPSENVKGKYVPDGKAARDKARTARKKIAILIDDIGYDLSTVDRLLEIDAPLTFAILPHCAHSVDAANILHKARREILLHLPMEPHTFPGENPGTGALLLRMTDAEIRKTVARDIDAVPHLAGVNNHMGSSFMEDGMKVQTVFTELKRRKLFFVDSRTTPLSKGPEIAKRLGLRFASRKIFIDNDHDFMSTFQNLTTRIDTNGQGLVMIGHPRMETIAALRKAIPILRARGIDVVPVSALVE